MSAIHKLSDVQLTAIGKGTRILQSCVVSSLSQAGDWF